MKESPSGFNLNRNEETLRKHYEEECALIKWKELDRFFAAGKVIEIKRGLSIVEAAVAMAIDDQSRFTEWVNSKTVSVVSDERAKEWFEKEAEILAVTVPPWVLVQRSD
ncbi:MAG: DUF2288 family protein [Spirochaetia bacterium]|nr:DUF2288 family protein [Spirochaetia bacterium]